MKSKEEQALKRLLLQAGSESPTPDFTGKVMQQIDAEAAQSIAFEPELKVLLQRHALATPPDGFTRHVMTRAIPAKVANEPVITAKIWWMLAAAILLLIGIGGLFPKRPQSTTNPFDGFYQSLPNLSSLFLAIPTTYVLGLGAVAVLLMIDYVLRYKITRTT